MKILTSAMMSVVAIYSAVLATPSTSELLDDGLWQTIAERYPFIFLAVVGSAGFLWFIRDWIQKADARETRRDEVLFREFTKLREDDRRAVAEMQSRFLTDIAAMQGRNEALQERSARVLEESVVALSAVRDILKDLNR